MIVDNLFSWANTSTIEVEEVHPTPNTQHYHHHQPLLPHLLLLVVATKKCHVPLLSVSFESLNIALSSQEGSPLTYGGNTLLNAAADCFLAAFRQGLYDLT